MMIWRMLCQIQILVILIVSSQSLLLNLPKIRHVRRGDGSFLYFCQITQFWDQLMQDKFTVIDQLREEAEKGNSSYFKYGVFVWR